MGVGARGGIREGMGTRPGNWITAIVTSPTASLLVPCFSFSQESGFFGTGSMVPVSGRGADLGSRHSAYWLFRGKSRAAVSWVNEWVADVRFTSPGKFLF